MIRVLLVDDHPVVLAGYQRFLEQAGDMCVVAQAADMEAALRAHASHHPDVTVTDLSMPGAGGLELVRRLLERDADTRCLVFTMHDSDLLVRRAFEVGARGFLSKSSPPEELLDAVRAVHSGRLYLAGSRSEASRTTSATDSPVDKLTPREFEVFRLLARGTPLSECARLLNLSPKTVSNHQTLIKDKLGVSTLAALAHLAIHHGVITPEAPTDVSQ
jgi:DNA-binding NarL/FixJ family response regulator